MWLSVGCVLGVVSSPVLKNIVVSISSESVAKMKVGGHEAMACIPSTESSSDVFFISCGGIY